MSASSSHLAIPADLMLPTDMVAELEDTPSIPATSHPKEGKGSSSSSSSSPSSTGNSLATNLIGQPPQWSGGGEGGSSGDDSLASSANSGGSKGGVESAPARSLNTSLRQSGSGKAGPKASSLPSTKIYNLPLTLEKKDSIASMASDGAVFYEIPLNSNDGLVKNAAYRRVIDTYRRRRNTLNRQIASDLCPSVCGTGPCPAGGNAMNCTLLHTEKPLSTYPVLPIHVNVPFSTQEVASVQSPHPRLSAGTMIPVWTTDKNSMHFLDSELLYTTAGSQDAMKHFGTSSSGPAPAIPLPSTNAFATTTADSQTDDPAAKQQQVKMQLCSHFCAKMCLRGPECNFLHIVHVEEREDEYSEPILSQLLRRHAVPKSPAQGRQDRSESFSSSMAGSSLNSSTAMQTTSFPTAGGAGPALEKSVIPNLSIIPHPPGVVQPQPDHPVVPALNASGGASSSGTGSLSSAAATPAPAGFLTKPPHHQQPVVAATSSSFPMMMMPPTPPQTVLPQQQQPVMMVPSATVPGHFVPVNAPVVPTAMAPTPAGAVYVPQQHAPQIPVQPPQMAMMMNPQGQQVLVPVVVPQPLHPQQQQHHQQQPVMMMTPPPAGIVPQHPRQQQ